MLWIEILTDGSFVKILSLLKWIYRNCIKCIICSKRSKLTKNTIVCMFCKMSPTGKCCLSFLPKNTNIAFDVLKGWANAPNLVADTSVSTEHQINQLLLILVDEIFSLYTIHIYWLLLDYWIRMRNYDPSVAMDQIEGVQYVVLLIHNSDA